MATKNGIIGLTSQRPTAQVPTFDWINSRVSTFLSFRDRQRTIEFVKLIREIRDLTPDVAKATYNVITLANPGYTVKVVRNSSLNTEAPVIDTVGQQIVDQFCERCFHEYSGAFDFGENVSKNYTGLDALINMCHLVTFTQGAFAIEVQLNPALDDIYEVFPVDPVYIDFLKDPQKLEWMPGINTFFMNPTGLQPKADRGFFPLNQTLFRYFPYAPDVNAPAGRSPLTPVLQVIFFQTQLYRDLQAINHQTNVPRLDIKLISEAIENVIKTQRPDLAMSTPANELARQQFLDNYIIDLQNQINNMSADDAFIHYDAVEAEYISPKPTSFALKDVLDAIDRSIISATLQLPVLLGRNEGATTTHATIQWQLYISQINTFQKISIAVVTWLLNLLLRLKGRNSSVVFEYVKHRTSDEFLTAQANNMDLQTGKTALQLGLISQDELANQLYGHNAVTPIDPEILTGQKIQPQPGLPGQPAAVVQDASTKAANE